MKRKLLGIFGVILCLISLMVFGNTEKVRANTCTTHTAYLFYSDIGTSYTFSNIFSTRTTFNHNNSTAFAFSYPDGAVNTSKIQIEMSSTGTTLDSGNVRAFWDAHKVATVSGYDAGKNVKYYSHGEWCSINGTDDVCDNDSVNLQGSYPTSAQLTNASMMVDTIVTCTVEDITSCQVRRTFTKTEFNRFSASDYLYANSSKQGLSNDPGNTGSLVAPALYKITYDICEEEEKEEETFSYEVNYCVYDGDNTKCNTKVADSKTNNDWNGNDKHQKSAPDDSNPFYSKYSSCKLKDSNESIVTITTSDRNYFNSRTNKYTRNVYYECSSEVAKTYTLYVRYWYDEIGSTLIKEYKKVELEGGSKFTGTGNEGIISVDSYTFSDISNIGGTLVRDGSDFTVTMPNGDVYVDLVYVPKTGDWYIYVVWSIGLIAFGYSVYYFNKYYKKEKAM